MCGCMTKLLSNDCATQQVMAIQQVYLAEGWHIFHFDGSAKHYSKAGWVSCHREHWEFSSPLDTLETQTHNRAELKAAISAVAKVTQNTVIFGDSAYVLHGVAGKPTRGGECNGACPRAQLPTPTYGKPCYLLSTEHST